MEAQAPAAASPVTADVKQQVVQQAVADVTGQKAPEVVSPEVKEAASQETAPKEQDFAEHFARIQKKERQLREKERQYQERIRALEQQAQIAQQLEADPMSVLTQKGWTLDKLLERVATGEDPKPTVEDKVSELQKKLDQLEAAKREAEEYARAQAEQKVIAEYKNQIKTIVDSDASRFEAIRTLGQYDLVFTTAEEIFLRDKKVPEIGEVAEAVERYLTQQLEKAFELQKFKARFEPKAAAETPAKAQETRIPGAQTLTSTATAVSKPPQGGKLLPKEDSLKEAAKLIRWT